MLRGESLSKPLATICDTILEVKKADVGVQCAASYLSSATDTRIHEAVPAQRKGARSASPAGRSLKRSAQPQEWSRQIYNGT